MQIYSASFNVRSIYALLKKYCKEIWEKIYLLSATLANMGLNDRKMMVNCEPKNLDDFHELILDNILSFLEMKQVVQTSVLSKRWRNLWKSQSILYFDHYSWDKITVEEVNYYGQDKAYLHRKEEFIHFVSKALSLQEGPIPRKFYLNGGCYCKEDYIFVWIYELVRQRVEEIYLQLCPVGLEYDCGLSMPDCVFTSNIKVFLLQVEIHSPDFTYQLPTSMCSALHLKRLHLASSRLPKGDSNGELVLSCPVLETLELLECDFDHLNIFTLSSPQLKHLVLEDWDRLWGRDGSCKIVINAPKLISLKCEALFEDYDIVNFPSLIRANIYCHAYKQVQRKSAFNLLSGTSNATTLELIGYWNNKTGIGSSILSEGMPSAFRNLRVMQIQLFKDSRVDFFVNMLKKSPYLEKLFVVFIQNYLTVDWTEDLSLECAFNHIKFIEIESYADRENDLKLLAFLLRSSMVLEKMRVIAILKISGDNELTELRMKLQALPKASSTAGLEIVPVTTPSKYVTFYERETFFTASARKLL